MKLGIDFGSTYTAVAVYDENKEILEALLLGGLTSPCIPTLVAAKKEKLEFGVVANTLRTASERIAPIQTVTFSQEEEIQLCLFR